MVNLNIDQYGHLIFFYFIDRRLSLGGDPRSLILLCFFCLFVFCTRKCNQFSKMHLASLDGEHEINKSMLWIIFAAVVTDWDTFNSSLPHHKPNTSLLIVRHKSFLVYFDSVCFSCESLKLNYMKLKWHSETWNTTLCWELAYAAKANRQEF